MDHAIAFFVHWATTALSLWIASRLFKGITFNGGWSLAIAALVLGFANAVVWPVLLVLTLPFTVLTLGLFLFVLNALVLMLVAALVKGFRVSGFWTALFASIVISLLSMVFNALVGAVMPGTEYQLPTTQQPGSAWL
jgi:putative membrane protein